MTSFFYDCIKDKVAMFFYKVSGNILKDFLSIKTINNKKKYIDSCFDFFNQEKEEFNETNNVEIFMTIDSFDNFFYSIPLISLVAFYKNYFMCYEIFTETFYYGEPHLFFFNKSFRVRPYNLDNKREISYFTNDLIPTSLLSCYFLLNSLDSIEFTKQDKLVGNCSEFLSSFKLNNDFPIFLHNELKQHDNFSQFLSGLNLDKINQPR